MLFRSVSQSRYIRSDLKSKQGTSKTIRLDGGDGKGFNVTLNNDDLLNASRERLANKKKLQEDLKKADAKEDQFYIDQINKAESNTKYNNDKNKPVDVPNSDTPTNTIAGGPGTKTPKNKPAKTEKDDIKQLQKQAHDEALASQQKQDEEEMALYYQKWQTRIDKMQDSLKKEEEVLLIARDKEKTAMATENASLENDIAELEKKKANAKSKIEIEELQKAIDAKRNIQFINNESDLIDERTHQYKLAKLREDWQLKDLEKSAEIEAKKLAQDRGKREEEITNISTLEEAKAQLKAQSDLKLTDQELRAIDNLEDAKKALREAAD